MPRLEPRSWSLQGRLLALVGCVLVIATVVGSTTGWALWRTSRATATQRQHTAPALADSRQLAAAMLDQETGERGYLVTGQESFLEPFVTGRAQTDVLVARLRRLLADEGNFTPLIDDVVEAHDAWLQETALPAIADVRAGRSQVAIAAEATGLGKIRFDLVRTRVGRLSAAVEARLTSVNAQIRQDARLAGLLAAGSALGIFVGSLLSLWLLRVWVTRPLERIGAGVKAVAGGDLSQAVRGSGPPDVQRLGTDVEAMRQRLLDELDLVRQAREALLQQGPAVELLRRALAPSPLATASPLISGRLIPAEGFLAGDWYDVQQTPRGTLLVSVVDVAGHGPSAGLFALRLKELLNVGVRQGQGPAELLGWLSAQIGTDADQYATAVITELDLHGRSARVAIGGHPPVIWQHRGAVTELAGTGTIIGMVSGEWHEHQLALDEDDLLLVYTDGLTETRDPSGDFFGTDGIRRVLAASEPGEHDDRRLVDRMVDAARRHGDRPFADDVTLVAIRTARRLVDDDAGQLLHV